MVVVRNDNQNNKALMKQDRPLPLTVFQKIVYLILNKDTHLELLPNTYLLPCFLLVKTDVIKQLICNNDRNGF